ncbi:hypothetical protein crov299a [Cafeteria roenbergensis virus]|uniref:Uncharacterized protein n=1 Tax=Cafeteria roenbergensis virus (strain BV-PW1) TaxID=693272 RepID=E3T570_CROVB|nr:hypothetical protein crov299a [Cafeteria roenbergensis virus BV-PW1]ADO67333.1 hypothetical protein crov299a [Cafeteria roenbergensis virus BV-PW1]
MQIIGIILILILILWLFFHKRTEQQEYFKGLAFGASSLPDLMKHYLL